MTNSQLRVCLWPMLIQNLENRQPMRYLICQILSLLVTSNSFCRLSIIQKQSLTSGERLPLTLCVCPLVVLPAPCAARDAHEISQVELMCLKPVELLHLGVVLSKLFVLLLPHHGHLGPHLHPCISRIKKWATHHMICSGWRVKCYFFSHFRRFPTVQW